MFFSHYRTAVTLMKRFCKENPVERIGYQKDGVLDIKKHRWFQVRKDYCYKNPPIRAILTIDINYLLCYYCA